MKALMVGLICSALLCSRGFSQDLKQEFTLVNKTGYDIGELYVSASNSNDWQEELLGDDNELEDDDTFNVRLTPRVTTCIWDIKVVYSDDDSSAVWRGIDLCTVSQVTLYHDRTSDRTSAKFD